MKINGLDRAAIYHTPDQVFAYPADRETLIVRIRTAKDDCKKICVRFKDIYDHAATPKTSEMLRICSDEHCDYYETKITCASRKVKYFFELTDKDGNLWDHSYSGTFSHEENKEDFFFYPFLFDEDINDSPEWANQGLIYQIFVDRFYNGDKSNDPDNCIEWNEMPASDSFYGGDIKGITQKLEHIASLGATMIYLSPIFLSDTNHKYDTIDYYTIDPMLGTQEDVKELVSKAHRMGIRIILDAVFNHCSNKNFLFTDVQEKGRNSKYYDWFSIRGPAVVLNPHNYDTFADVVPEMPKLNTSNPKVQDYLIKAAIHWTKTLDIDGWRLDVADEVSHALWKKFRERLKSVKPDIFILGEVWNRATPWLAGDEFDSVTNYRFRNALLDIAKDRMRTNKQLWNDICHNEMNYKSTVLPFLVNLVSSHDVKRILTELNGKISLTRLLLGILLTYRGIPLIYYGDELGMEGNEDPDNRRTINWDKEQQDDRILDFVQKLGNLRKKSDALRNGTVRIIQELPDRVVGYERSSIGQKDRLIVLANFDQSYCIVNLQLSEKIDIMISCLDDRKYYPDGYRNFNIKLKGYDFVVLSVG